MPPEIPRHPIRVVVERTGLTAATVRAWERRYRAVAPTRTEGAQRLYTDHDIQRLQLIARLAAMGNSLADLGAASTTTLSRMARQALEPPSGDAAVIAQASRAAAIVTRLLDDTRALDAPALRARLSETIVSFGTLTALDTVVAPYLDQVGVAWACREISVAQEHLASAVVRDVLGALLQHAPIPDDAPVMVATTLADELHEFGAMMAAVVAASREWRVVYLGPNLPGTEIGTLARDAGARAVTIGIVMPQPTRSVRDELGDLRRAVGRRTAVFAGGAAAADHQVTLRNLSVELLESRAAFGERLDRMRGR
ncbi:MAG TPA: MerR family transcriptional regulator [Gemmatimonadaceae bacterium]|nr:MerR family transcriptional regulator [Gemmatimonadaceae bacterium]